MNKMIGVALLALLAQAGVMLIRPAPARPAPLLDEQAGRLREIVVHYAPSSGFVADTYDDFFAALPADVKVFVAVEKRGHADAFARRFRRDAVAVVVGRPITTWSRDRFAACEGAIAIPPEVHAGRPNDRLVPIELANATGAASRIAPFRFDGGDFCAVGGKLVVTSTWTSRTPDRRPEDLVAEAERFFGMPVVYLPEAPEHHVGMAFAPVGPNAVLVGDMKWGRRLAPGIEANDAEDKFDAMADGFRRAGFTVHRVPAIVTAKDYAWITYTNGIHEDRVVYMPVFGVDALDRAAGEVYRSLGFEVRPVRVSKTWALGGTLHCLVHVVSRDATSGRR